MTGDPRPPAPRLGPALAPEAGRRRPALPAWLGAIAVLGALISIGCDGGVSGVVDRGSSDAAVDASYADAMASDAVPPDAIPPDGMDVDGMGVDGMDVDGTVADGMVPDAATPPQATSPAVIAAGATVESGRYRLRLSVGGPSPMHVTSSERLKARIGVALSLPYPEERSR